MGKSIKEPAWRKYFISDMKRCITSYHFWMDSFGQYIYRWFLCPLFGHKKVHMTECWDETLLKEVKKPYCFHCYRQVKDKHE